MFLLICGEDSAAARNYVASLKKAYREKNSRVLEVSPSELEEELKNETSVSLFGEPIIYIVTGLLGQWGKQKKKAADEIKKLHENENVKIIAWEGGKSLYDMKMKIAPYIKEFKVDTSIFDLQESLLPGKKAVFIEKLSKLKQTQDPFLLYTQVHRHTRLMLLLNTGQATGNVHPFIKQKASTQAKRWDTKKLSQFYFGLTKIDQAIKTSGTPYTIPQSLEILACYYL